ncbi:hypothetical protein CRG98_005384 [Punica granatum]|uniref:Uncharacterized protein n=1 Tax=Punica granatum TaxID=22663 RepID=A0A2I0L1W7_PUNGR|nr:hypothetical protein CRG98_005384 [Punica granatum]
MCLDARLGVQTRAQALAGSPAKAHACQYTHPCVPTSLTLQCARQCAHPCTSASQRLHARALAYPTLVLVHLSTHSHAQLSHPNLQPFSDSFLVS